MSAAGGGNSAATRGLDGIVVANTEMSMVDGQVGHLMIRGYDIEEIAGRASFEEVAYLLWHGTLSEMGMVVISSTVTVGPISQTLDPAGEPMGEAGKFLERSFSRFADDLTWWTEAATAQRQRKAPPY